MNRLFLIFVLMVFTFPSHLFAETGQRLTVDGYQLHISATKLSDKLIVRGSIKGGENCQHMSITVYLKDENGHQESISAVLKNYKYSNKFTVKETNTSGGNRWIVSDAYISKK